MIEILKLLRDAVGIRPLIPVIIVVALGLLFKVMKEYPVRELLYDRWYLLSVLAVASLSVGYMIWTSSLAERTPEGRYGVYVARLQKDPERKAHDRLFEELSNYLHFKAHEANIRLDILDLGREIADDNPDEIVKIAESLNATVLLWGKFWDNKEIYPRIWSSSLGVPRSWKESEILDIENRDALRNFSSFVWKQVEQRLDNQNKSVEDTRVDEITRQLASLETEVVTLRKAIGTDSASTGLGTPTPPKALAAILVGVGDYGGQADLKGPPNDVRALGSVLVSRSDTWEIHKLLNKDATEKRIRELIEANIRSLSSEEPLLVYFSGHTSRESDGQTFFYLSDLKQRINLVSLVNETIKKHPRSIFVVDGGFDPRALDSVALGQAAVIAADPEGLAVEIRERGESLGAFTAALVTTLRGTSSSIGIPVPTLFGQIRGELLRKNVKPIPVVLYGNNPPVL